MASTFGCPAFITFCRPPQTTPTPEGDPRTQTFRDVGSKLQEGIEEFSQIFLSEDLILALKRMDSSVEKFGYRSSVDIRFVDRNRLNIPRLLSDPAEGLAFQHALWLGLEGCSLQGNFYAWNHAPMDLSETDFFIPSRKSRKCPNPRETWSIRIR